MERLVEDPGHRPLHGQHLVRAVAAREGEVGADVPVARRQVVRAPVLDDGPADLPGLEQGVAEVVAGGGAGSRRLRLPVGRGRARVVLAGIEPVALVVGAGGGEGEDGEEDQSGQHVMRSRVRI